MPAESPPNQFKHYEVLPPGPPRRAANVVPDNADLPFVCRYIWIGVAGDLVIVTDFGDTVTYPAHPAGRHEIAAKRILPATTAGNLVIEA
jgi:hypothetical protein